MRFLPITRTMKKVPAHIVIITTLSILVVVFLIIIIKKSSKKGKEDKAKKDLQEDAEDLGIVMDDVVADVDQIRIGFGISIAFGLDWPWEDENAVVNIILTYDPDSFDILADAYNRILGRSLISDINRYLSDSDIQEIAHIIL